MLVSGRVISTQLEVHYNLSEGMIRMSHSISSPVLLTPAGSHGEIHFDYFDHLKNDWLLLTPYKNIIKSYIIT